VNAIDLSSFELDENGLVQFSRQIVQTPIPRKGVDATKTSLSPFVQTNENGIRLYANVSSVDSDFAPRFFKNNRSSAFTEMSL
jgi:hypothetical protein